MKSQVGGTLMDVEYEPYFDDEPELPRAWSLPDHWSPFEPIGNGISCSYCEIAPEIWTWKFRNDGTRKITVMTFRFQDEDGWRDGILPLSLKPGGICGGSAAFTAHRRPQILVRDIHRL